MLATHFGEYREIVRPSRIIFTFGVDKRGPFSLVSVDIRPDGAAGEGEGEQGGAAYDKVRKFVTDLREKGMTDDEIEAEALLVSGKKPGGEGISGSNRLAAGSNLAKRMAEGEGAKRGRKPRAEAGEAA